MKRIVLGLFAAALLFILFSIAPQAFAGDPTTRPAASFANFDARAKAGHPMNVVFFGGSLTWGANASDPQRTSYRGLMQQYLSAKYPNTQFTFHDAAIGGTGSPLGMFRLDRDVLSRNPDLVFLDFTANDDPAGGDAPTLASYECLLREMIGRGVPVVQMFFAFKGHFGSNYHPEKLWRYLNHKKLAAAYHTAVGDSLPLVQAAILSNAPGIDTLWPFEESHPDDVGYRIYFEAGRQGLEQAIADGRTCVVPEQPVFSSTYMKRQRIELTKLSIPDGWHPDKTFRTSLFFDYLSSRWMDDVLVCDSKAAAPAEPLKLQFQGTFLGVFGEADENGLPFRVSVDGTWLSHQVHGQATDVWSFDARQFKTGRVCVWHVISTKLAPGRHELELDPVKDGANPDGQLRINSICVAGE